jgi:hypothetical protein
MPASKNAVPQLEDYGMDLSTGFVPNPTPLRRLPPEFEPWETIMDDFVGYIMTGTLRERIQKVAVTDIARCIIYRGLGNEGAGKASI